MASAGPGVLPPGVHLLERGWLSSNNIVVAGRASTAVIDTGYGTHASHTLALVRHVLGERNLDTIANTHLHSDHCGGNAILQSAYPGASTLVPPGLAQQVDAWDPHALTYEPTGQYCPPFTRTGKLIPGSAVELGDMAWQIYAAPGHDCHAVLLFQREHRLLISGDALWQNGFGIVFEELEGVSAFGQVGKTLDLIEMLDPACVLPGHGSAFCDARTALTTARKRLNYFRQYPERHAHYAAKVLLKFKLLECHRMVLQDFQKWATAAGYLQQMHERFFSQTERRVWINSLFDELVQAKAAAYVGDEIVDA